MTTSPFRTFLRGSLISLSGTGLLGIMNYFVRRTLCINLAPADYGLFYSTLALLTVIYTFSDLGLNQSATALIAKYAGTEKRYRSFNAFALFRLFLILTATAVVCSFAGILSKNYLKTENFLPVLLLAAMFCFQSMSGCFISLYNGRKEFGTQQTVQLAGAAVLLSCVVLFGKTLVGCAAAFTVSALIAFIGNFVLCVISGKTKLAQKPVKEDWTELCRLGGWLAISTTLFTTLYYMDTIMLTAVRGVESAALYNVALPIMQIVQAGMVFPSVMLPIAMDMSKEKNFAGLRRFALWGLGITLLLVPVCYGFFSWSGRWLIVFLFAEKYAAAAPAVSLLCTAQLFFTLGNFLLQLLIALNHVKNVVLIAAICFLCNVCLNWFFIRSYDYTGASLATLCSYLIFCLLSFFFFIRKCRGSHE